MANSLAIASAGLPNLLTAANVSRQSSAADFSDLLLSFTLPQTAQAEPRAGAGDKATKTTPATIDASIDPSLFLYMGGTVPANLTGKPDDSQGAKNPGSPVQAAPQSLAELPLEQFDVRSIEIVTEVLPPATPAAISPEPAAPVTTNSGSTGALPLSKPEPDLIAALTPIPTVSMAAPVKTAADVRASETKTWTLPELFPASPKGQVESSSATKLGNGSEVQPKFTPDSGRDLGIASSATAVETLSPVLTPAVMAPAASHNPGLQQLQGPSPTSTAASKDAVDSGSPESNDSVQSAQSPPVTMAATALDAKTAVLKAGSPADSGAKDSDDQPPASSQPSPPTPAGATDHPAVFASDTPAATPTLSSQTAQAATPAAAVHQPEISWNGPTPAVARHVSIDVGEGDSSVRITIHERAGDISVKIDSATETLHGQLQSSAGTLLDALRREQVPLSNLNFSATPDHSADPDQRRQRNPNQPKSQKTAAKTSPAIFADSVNLQT